MAEYTMQGFYDQKLSRRLFSRFLRITHLFPAEQSNNKKSIPKADIRPIDLCSKNVEKKSAFGFYDVERLLE